MSDTNLVDIGGIISEKRQKQMMRKLDAQAAYINLEQCLIYLNMNSMKELDSIKKDIKATMKKLAEIGQNG